MDVKVQSSPLKKEEARKESTCSLIRSHDPWRSIGAYKHFKNKNKRIEQYGTALHVNLASKEKKTGVTSLCNVLQKHLIFFK